MTETIECISPIDGSVFATRNVMPVTQAHEAVDRAKVAQKPSERRKVDPKRTSTLRRSYVQTNTEKLSQQSALF